MKPAALVLVVLASCGMPAFADSRTATSAERAACEAPLTRQLEDIESRLRRGYSAREGNDLKARRRELERQRLGCRRYPPTQALSPQLGNPLACGRPLKCVKPSP